MGNWTPETQDSETPGYSDYHKRVVNACAMLMGEQCRDFFEGCSFDEQFTEKDGPRDPEEVAQDERDAI